ncbi:ethanolamine utilization protein EutP [Enterococcus gilvus]|jgi:ethanolamine utilization protein EutP|nr:ethanolamine utilization protein EutP [Enterococcus gilvus]
MRKHLMIIGPANSGKSTVANWLNETDRPLKKTQDAIYGKYTIDAPAAYLENDWMYRYLFSISQTAGRLLCLADGKRLTNLYPPNFVRAFNCPVTGLIKAPETEAEKETAIDYLKAAGIDEWYVFDLADEKLRTMKEQWIAELGGQDEVYH